MDWLTADERAYFDLKKAVDHDLLVQIHQAIYEPDNGLKAQVSAMRKTLQGNGKIGLVETVRNHEKQFESADEDRRKFRNRIYLAIVLIVPFLTVLFNQVINWRFGK